MKVTQEHLHVISAAVQPLDTRERRARYRRNEFPRADKVKDKDKRYRWDLFWDAKLSQFAMDTLYTYSNDDHIDTALRSLVPSLDTV